jgi:hypothetical protein
MLLVLLSPGQQLEITARMSKKASAASYDDAVPVANHPLLVPVAHTPHRKAASALSSSTSASRHADPAAPTVAPTIATIEMDYGDAYTGEVAVHPGNGVTVPNGQGTLQSTNGRHCYVGAFVHQQREGNGKLVTDHVAVWGKWHANRPVFTASVRVDYPNGDKYSGYVNGVTAQGSSAQNAGLSKFSAWVNNTKLLKSGWGEMVYHDGKRYFGQWTNDEPNGFGCLLTAERDRYVGQWDGGLYDGPGVYFARNGTVYDGTFAKGAFACAEGDVTVAGQVRVTAEWDDMVRFKNATVTLTDRRSLDKKFALASQFEPLMNASSETSQRRSWAQAAPLRAALAAAAAAADVDLAVRDHIANNESFGNCVKIMRRCFYFYYGTCGHGAQRGGGSGSNGNPLGWCFLRRSHGGCIHRGYGDAVHAGMAYDALSDVLSFVASARRWLLALVDAKHADIFDRFDCDALLSKRLLDALLPLVHAPLFNLYQQSFVAEQMLLDAALHRLRHVSMDDLGITFAREHQNEKLFAPYADAINTLRQLGSANTLSGKLRCLKRWSGDIDQETRVNQIRLQDDGLDTMSSYARDHHGAATTPQQRQLDGAAAGDAPAAATPPSAATLLSEGAEEPGGVSNDSLTAAAGNVVSRAFNVVAGSADDLFPIHQFVLMRCGIPDITAHTRLLVDLASVDWSVDPTSQDMFCATTLHACVTMMPEMHGNLRDQGVVMPTSAVRKRIDDAVTLLDERAMAPTVLPLCGAYCAAAVQRLSRMVRENRKESDGREALAGVAPDACRVVPLPPLDTVSVGDAGLLQLPAASTAIVRESVEFVATVLTAAGLRVHAVPLDAPALLAVAGAAAFTPVDIEMSTVTAGNTLYRGADDADAGKPADVPSQRPTVLVINAADLAAKTRHELEFAADVLLQISY